MKTLKNAQKDSWANYNTIIMLYILSITKYDKNNNDYFK